MADGGSKARLAPCSSWQVCSWPACWSYGQAERADSKLCRGVAGGGLAGKGAATYLLDTILIHLLHFAIFIECPQKVSTKSVHKKCSQNVSTKCVHKMCAQKVSTESVHKKLPQTVSKKSVHKICPTKNSSKHAHTNVPRAHTSP